MEFNHGVTDDSTKECLLTNMTDLNVENWVEQAADVMTDSYAESDGPLVCVKQSDGKPTVTHPPSATTATGDTLQTALVKTLLKLHDRTIDLPSTREGMRRINVDALDGALPNNAVVTKTAIEEGYIAARHEIIPATDIRPSYWRAGTGVAKVRGGKVHTELAAALDGVFRMQGYRTITYEKRARYGPKTEVAADVAIPHAGVYGEAGDLSDDSDKIAHCLDIGRDGILGSPNHPQLSTASHIYHDPPSNPVREIVWLPFFEDDERLRRGTDVELPMYAFSRTDKEL